MKLTLAVLLTIPQGTMGAYRQPDGPCSEPELRITRGMPLGAQRWRSRALVRCAFERFAPVELETALRVADRESGFDPYAFNGTCCKGLFQHHAAYWHDRVRTYLERRWFPNTWPSTSPFRARANVIVTALMVKRFGWGAWTTA